MSKNVQFHYYATTYELWVTYGICQAINQHANSKATISHLDIVKCRLLKAFADVFERTLTCKFKSVTVKLN